MRNFTIIGYINYSLIIKNEMSLKKNVAYWSYLFFKKKYRGIGQVSKARDRELGSVHTSGTRRIP